ncbi:substrate-binding domain-containing protein [Cohnella sp. WQ 127256]|uniref:sugar ABC transporter substrate-binding protein n=1 Tax=Cohnella sp. WQ 127256 TaxID=2938790 RepID=UPI0021186CAE|nr:substrate-binding domain-containing protein [Cohnella sp. WQ 127256]
MIVPSAWRKPLLCFLLPIALLSVILSGCTKDVDSVAPPPSTTSPIITKVATAYTFGIIYPMTHPFYETITRTAELAAAESNVQLIVKAPGESNLEQQIRMMETMIRQQVDGIAIDPIDANALAPIIDKAVNSGIPVICFESDSPASQRLTYIGTNNLESGRRMGESLDKLLDGSGMVLVETGTRRTLSMDQRLEGMLTYLNNKTKIQVLEVRYNEGSEIRALRDLEEMIDSHPHFDAFVGLDFVSGSASILVWKAKGLARYALTFGLTPEIQEAIRNGQLTSVLSQHEEEWGNRIIARLLDAAEGRQVPRFDDTGFVEVSGNR